MLSLNEVMNAITDAELSCLDIDDESVERDIDVVLDHLRRLYSTDSSREGIEAALKEAGFEVFRQEDNWALWDRKDVAFPVMRHTDGTFTVMGQKLHNVGELLHLVAAAEMAQEGEATNDN